MKRSFWFHYNKPASKKAGETRITVHWMGACEIVSKVKCHVYTETRNRKTQPHCVVTGKCFSITIINNEAIIL